MIFFFIAAVLITAKANASEMANMTNVTYDVLPQPRLYAYSFLVQMFSAKQVNFNEIVVFDTVTSDPSNSYSAGVFNCPVAGSWVFAFTITSRGEHHYGLLVNNLYIAGVHAGTGTDLDATGHSKVVIYCNVGMTVVIKKLSNGTTPVWGDNFSHFTGFLLV